jgi:large subunit ribosomal protein L21
MYAVIRTGGKQYRVAKNDVIMVERLAVEAGEKVVLDDVLMVADDAGVTLGTPTVAGAEVVATVLEQMRDDKIVVFKKKRRLGYRRKKGHRQALTVLRIADITKAAKKAKPKTARKAAAKTGEAKAAKPAAGKGAKAAPEGETTKDSKAAPKAEAKPVGKAEENS